MDPWGGMGSRTGTSAGSAAGLLLASGLAEPVIMTSPCATDAFAETLTATDPTRRGGSTTDARVGPGVLVAGRYRLERKIGEGGMAEVWLAVHEALRHEVAVKFATAPAPYGMVPELLERFRFEAQVSAQLGARTEHVVCVHDAGEHDAGERPGIPYLVMEYVKGTTLADAIAADGPMPPERVADVLDQVADALDVAHALGIVHRDLKPGNVMLARALDGTTTVKLADFGIAKATRKDLALDNPKETAFGITLGSPAYMSPEQIGGDGIGVQTDLWALGVVAYEALTGRDAFQAQTQPQLFESISSGRYMPATSVRMGLPSTLDPWFARALAHRAEDRFTSAGQMAKSFRAAFAPPQRRNTRWLAAIPLLGAVVILALAATAAANKTRASASSAPASTTTASVTPPASVPAGSAAVAPSSEGAVPTAEAPAASSSGAPPARTSAHPTRHVTNGSPRRGGPRKGRDPSDTQ